MRTVGRQLPLSAAQADLTARARAQGWTVRREPGTHFGNERLRFARRDVVLLAVFSHDGAFAYGRVIAPDGHGVELDLPAVQAALARWTPVGGGPPAGGRAGYSSRPGSPPAPAGAASAAPDAPVPAGAVPSRMAGPSPEETPPAEASTTAGISVPEPPELRWAWGPWPLVIIGLLVVCVVVFLVARIFA